MSLIYMLDTNICSAAIEGDSSVDTFDSMIAAHALSRGLIVVTDNVKHFSPVPGLRIENWLRP